MTNKQQQKPLTTKEASMYKDEIWSRETQERYVEGVLNAVLGTAFELGLEEDS